MKLAEVILHFRCLVTSMNKHKYTEDEAAFFKEYCYGHSYKEIQAEFISRFGWDITVRQIKCYISNHGLNTGRTGRFEKGHVPANKGVPMTPEQYAKCAPTMFRKGESCAGNTPMPLGSEVFREGYVMVKVAQPNIWRFKSHIVWEEHNGAIPPGHIITYKDGDPLNCDIDNLILISRRVSQIMSLKGLHKYTGERKVTAINIAKLICARNNAINKMKKGGNYEKEKHTDEHIG